MDHKHISPPTSILRNLALENYISSSSIHQPLTNESLQSFLVAYKYYLRGWIPSGLAEKRWLDLACGQGALLMVARDLGCSQIEGVDASDEMLSQCRKHGFNVTKADVFEHMVQMPRGSVDIVSAFDILEHFPKDEGFLLLREIRRILSPEGTAFIKVPNAASPWGQAVTASDITHEAEYTAVSLRQIALLAGFSNAEFREVGPAPTSLKSRIRKGLWSLLRQFYISLNVIEAGCPISNILTRVMICRLSD